MTAASNPESGAPRAPSPENTRVSLPAPPVTVPVTARLPLNATVSSPLPRSMMPLVTEPASRVTRSLPPPVLMATPGVSIEIPVAIPVWEVRMLPALVTSSLPSPVRIP